MATAALIGIGLDRTIGCLISDLSLTDYHRIVVEVTGIKRPGAVRQFQTQTLRQSPTSNESSVSSTQTFDAFWQSILGIPFLNVCFQTLFVFLFKSRITRNLKQKSTNSCVLILHK